VYLVKAFLTHSGIDDFPNTNAQHLCQALLILKKHNTTLLVHCELDTPQDDYCFGRKHAIIILQLVM
jgi:allantoinase